MAVKQGYGLSEAGPAVMVQVVNELWRFAGSVGGLLPNVRAKIVREDGGGGGGRGCKWRPSLLPSYAVSPMSGIGG